MSYFKRLLTLLILLAHTFVSSAAGAVLSVGAWDAYAAVTTLATHTTLGMLSTGGNLGRVLESLGKPQFLKKLAVNVGTAGLAHKIGTDVLKLPPDQMSMGQHVALTLQEKALWAAVHHGVGTVLETGIQGQKFGETLRHRALTGVAEVGGAEFAKMLGQTYRLGEGEINYVTHKLGHALVGGGMGALLSSDDHGRGALTGALSGMLSEVVAEKMLNPQGLGQQLVQGEMTPSGLQTHLHDAVRNIRLGLSTLALLAHGDPQIADTVSQNALENNAIPAVLAVPAIANYIVAVGGFSAAMLLLHQKIVEMQKMDRAPEALTGLQILDTPIAENAPFQESFTVEDLQALILGTPNASEVLQQLQHLPGFDIILQFLQGIQIFTSDGEGTLQNEILQTVLKKIHKNSLDYVGPTHLYAIREDGKVVKYGESALGKNKYGQSKRAEAQVRKLEKLDPDKEYKSQVIQDYGSKREVREKETKYITTHRKVFGKDSLPQNKNNR